jgi:sarcosine oxidase subunit beta
VAESHSFTASPLDPGFRRDDGWGKAIEDHDMSYNIFSLAKNALSGHKNWQPAWREPEPKASYDVIIVGGGGHGLATAYYLAKEHGITNVAVLEKSWLGSGNIGRNTTIIRSNYMLEGNNPFYEWSMKLWEGLEQDFNFNAMVSQRGIMNLFHSDAQRDAFARRGNAMRIHGVDAELIDREQVREKVPFLSFDDARFPIQGALIQKRGGTVRHDAVAWGFARGADSRGVDIIQNCEVQGIKMEGGKAVGVETSRGFIGCNKLALCAAGNSSEVAVGHFYVSQSDKGGLVFGGDIDGYNSYARRGGLPTVEHVIEAGVSMIPGISRVKILRSWGGIMDMSMDGSPIIDKTHIDNMYLNCGWCYGGFKATPASGWCYAWTIAKDGAHELNSQMRLDRFRRGYMMDEKGMGAQPNLH